MKRWPWMVLRQLLVCGAISLASRWAGCPWWAVLVGWATGVIPYAILIRGTLRHQDECRAILARARVTMTLSDADLHKLVGM